MRKIAILIIVICAYQVNAIAQKVVHNHYTTYYNAIKKEPDSVVWNLSPEMVACSGVVRKDHFAKDPSIPASVSPAAYTNSGYDKGHLFNWDDARCSTTDIRECFYMTNMLPQIHAFNAGDWESVEKYERELAAKETIHIIAGGIGSLGKTASGVNIPASMWKAIYADHTWTCWIMDNKSTSVKHDITYWQKNISDFDALTGLKLE